MNFRSEVREQEIVSAKSGADLKSSYSITAAKLQTIFEVLDSRKASGLKKISQRRFERRVFVQRRAAQKYERFLTGRQVAWMISEYFKFSDAGESNLDLNEIF